MNDKVKLQVKYEPEYKVVEFCGQEIKVLKQIPYDKKLAYAQEFASNACVIDVKQGVAYENYDTEALSVYMVCKYYTNIDLKDFELDMGALHDVVVHHMRSIKDVCAQDLFISDSMAYNHTYRTIEIYNQQNSLSQKIKMSLGGILNGEDLIQTIAESRVVNEEMIDLLMKAKKQDEQEAKSVVLFPGMAKKGE